MPDLLDPHPAAPRSRTLYDASATEEKTLKAHLPLLRSVVDRIKASLPAHVEVEDLYSAGLVGLIHAARKFDPTLGTTFAGFATRRIRGAVLDELRRLDWMSRSTRGKAKKLVDVIAEVEQRLGRPASEAEIAGELSMGADDYAALLEEVKPVAYVMLDDVGLGGEEGSLHEIVADENQATAIDEVMKRELIGLVTERLQRLPDIQRKVLAMYYFENLRLAEIAAVFKVTESRICQIHSQAVLSIRAYVKSAVNR